MSQFAVGQNKKKSPSAKPKEKPYKTSELPKQKLAKDLVSAIKEINKVVVQVITEFGNGTGFYVGTEGHVLTNFHVVSNDSNRVSKQVVIRSHAPSMNNKYMTTRRTFAERPAEVIDTIPGYDLALIKVSNSLFESKMHFIAPLIDRPEMTVATEYYGKSLISVSKREEGEQITVSGYPYNYPALVTNTGYISNLEGNWKLRKFPDFECYLVDMPINPGNSGGPVYKSTTGEIIGVAVATLYADKFDGVNIALAQDRNGQTGYFALRGIDQVVDSLKKVKDPAAKDLIGRIVDSNVYYQFPIGLGSVIPIQLAIPLLERNKIKWK